MILSYQAIKARGPWVGLPGMIEPMCERSVHEPTGMTYGLGPAGYDIRVKQELVLATGSFQLASSLERFAIPNDLCGHVRDKSTLIRRGLMVGNTVLEPGWDGWITLELFYLGPVRVLRLPAGSPIAQVQFSLLDQSTALPYAGRYQNQPDRAVPAVDLIAERAA